MTDTDVQNLVEAARQMVQAEAYEHNDLHRADVKCEWCALVKALIPFGQQDSKEKPR